jgi:hypothetical protein
MNSSITAPNSLWGDVFTCGNGVIGCAYDLLNNVAIEFHQLQDDKMVLINTGIVPFNEHVLFVRACQNGRGRILVAGQGNTSGRFLAGILNDEFNHRLLTTYGTHSVAVSPTQYGFDYVVQVSTTEYYDSFSNTYYLIPSAIWGTSNGIIQLRNGQPIWADLVRTSIPEMQYPFRQNDVYVGEGAADPPHIQALENDIQKNIFNGYAARPRCAFDAEANIFAVASRSVAGVTFNFFERPLTDVTVVVPEPPIPEPEPPIPEPPDMACTPVAPGHDIIAASMSALREFCQNYVAPPHALPEYAGKKPYENDEIHENGLFLADGLLFFILGNTGRWAQIMMNPDDKRPPEEKRQSADAALHEYMRARCGDTPTQKVPGGTLSGDVNV